MGRRTTHKYAHLQRLSFTGRFLLVYAYTTVYLVMQTDLFILDILIARKLYAVHTQVSIHHTRLFRILAVYLRQGDEGTTIHRPVVDLRQVADPDALKIIGQITILFRQGIPGGKTCAYMFKRGFQRLHRVILQPYDLFGLCYGLAKQEFTAVQVTEQI
ncbi:hypothetical protein D3C86_1413880 [compost metagenome]